MKYMHTMVRVRDLDQALDFYCDKLGLTEVRRIDRPEGRYTLVFLCASEDLEAARAGRAPLVELTYNYDTEDYQGGRNFGHLAYEVDDLYAACERLMKGGVTINRPPRDGYMAFVRSPDGISIELIQKGPAQAPAEPWASMPNVGAW
jgi:lactoylglutathione lyase